MSITRTAGARGGKTLRMRHRRLVAILSVIGVLSTASIVAGDVQPANAVDYPSWSDVMHARKSTAKARAAVTHIKALVKELDAKVARTQADQVKKGDAYQAADQALAEAANKAAVLQKQAKKADKQRKTSEAQAGQLAAQLARGGSSGDVTLNLFLNGDDATKILGGIGDANKQSERTNQVYEKAVQDKNTAQALTDQAKVAKSILADLKVKAADAFKTAQTAAAAAQTAFDESKTHRVILEAQLKVIASKKNITEKQYLKGLKAQYGAGASIGAGQVAPSGWAKPANGYISSGFGWRIHPIYHYLRLHTGTDIANACATPIYAAHAGTVIYAGWYGTYGNFILIDNGNGLSTGYAHIVNGGIRVHLGQGVAAGQNIAITGMTGAATGCHLHFEVRRNGVAFDAVPFMRSQGITLG
jgi:murein DD-endopeptidase MepM/ murein hydrolase activator NlpD